MGEETRRRVALRRSGPARFVATNVRGGTLDIGSGEGTTFTPVELLLAAMGACSGIDVDMLTSRRAEPVRFEIDVHGDKIRDDSGNHLGDIEVSFTVTFPEGAAGDAARAVLPDVVHRSHERLCTVTRTVVRPTSVTVDIKE